MKLYDVTPKISNRIKSTCISDEYIYALTGKRIIVYDKSFNTVYTVEGLKYTYNGILSPDNSKLLAIASNNTFCVLSTKEKQIRKFSICGTQFSNLEGRGCWGRQSDDILIPVFDEMKQSTFLRKYNINDSSYEEVEFPKYKIEYIKPLTGDEKYIIIGRRLDLIDELADYSIILYNENECIESSIKHFEDALIRVDVFEDKKAVCLHGSACSVFSDFQGDAINGNPFKQDFESAPNGLHRLDLLEGLLKINEFIRAIHFINDDLCLIGTSKRFLALDLKSKSTAEAIIEYGAHEIHELEKSTVLISTWNGFKVFKVERTIT